ncbi:hypothetical protein [Curvibacter lanceolatus]|uniref:hypothetical protein n=1 Tax=Curvibacter lanceolatus TaxID=86182 RepID=UPI00036C1606|nr:hypothetical protein [Curvibacter lanceolatus]
MDGMAFIEHRLHGGVVVLGQRSHQGCRQHGSDLIGLLAGLIAHGVVQQAQAVAHQQGQHHHLDQQGGHEQAPAHSAPRQVQAHHLPCLRVSLTSLA